MNSTQENALSAAIQLNPAYEPSDADDSVTYYLYCPDTFVATKTVKVAPDATPPENGTKWQPPPCSTNVQAYFDGFGWVRCPSYKSMTPELLRTVLIDVAKRELREAMTEIKDSVADEETETYLQQYADAQSYIATGTASTFLKVLSEARGKPLDDLAEIIVRKADAYHTATASALAKYQNVVDEIMSTKPVLTQEMLRERRLQRT